jgi:adenine-specific DNA-methyltransferase
MAVSAAFSRLLPCKQAFSPPDLRGFTPPPTVSHGADGIACWFIDTDYNEESFFVRHAYFLGANDPYSALKTTLKAEIDPEAWATLNSDTSRPFEKPKSGRIAVKVINHLGDEVMKVFKVG